MFNLHNTPRLSEVFNLSENSFHAQHVYMAVSSQRAVNVQLETHMTLEFSLSLSL